MPILNKGSYRGCLCVNSADVTGVNAGSAVALTFNTDTYDTDAIHDTSSNTSRLTVPTGVTKVRLTYGILMANVTGATDVFFNISKAGSDTGNWYTPTMADTSSTNPRASASSPVLTVVGGDYFELKAVGDASCDFLAPYTFFAMEIIE